MIFILFLGNRNGFYVEKDVEWIQPDQPIVRYEQSANPLDDISKYNKKDVMRPCETLSYQDEEGNEDELPMIQELAVSILFIVGFVISMTQIGYN